MRLLCRYAGGLACLVTALALVACGGGPGSQPEPKQIEDSTLAIGKSLEIALGDKFNGSDLTFGAATSSRSVATVTVDDNDTLTVTAVGAGTATITVTAKNSRGEAKQTFTVTVPKPPATDPEPVDIPNIPSLERDGTRRIPLGDKFSGENLTYRATSSHDHVATVRVEADTLTVTAVGPGTATITVTATAAAQGSTPQTKRFTVTVPPPEVTVPTVKTGAITSIDVVIGTPETVALSEVFDGATSYGASSSASTIATASVSGETLTIIGAGAGSATITVTGRNAAGPSPAHAIVARVTPADTGDTGGTGGQQGACTQSTRALTITINTSKKCTLSANLSLLYDDPSGKVSVDGPVENNVWTITANKKGISAVKINNNETGPTGDTITVTVPNTPPKLKPDPAAPADPLRVIRVSDLFSDTGFDLAGSFEDDDPTDYDNPTTPAIEEKTPTANPFLRFRVLDKPDSVLIGTHNGFVAVSTASDGIFDSAPTNADAIFMEATILKKHSANTYDIRLYAYDLDNGESDNPVTLRVTAQDPVSPSADDAYSLVKGTGSSYNKTKPIGNRIGVPHTITLTLTGEGAYDFYSDLVVSPDDVKGKMPRGYTGTPTVGDTICSNLRSDASATLGEGCWYATTSNTKVTLTQTVKANLQVTLDSSRTLSDTSDPSITIAYYAVDDVTEGEPLVQVKRKTLTVDIHKCVDVDDCP